MPRLREFRFHITTSNGLDQSGDKEMAQIRPIRRHVLEESKEKRKASEKGGFELHMQRILVVLLYRF